ncbi:hypothetical protein [Brevibacterium jeotgali]|uniref:Uncharacterized conserved protein n=1 Tax=Brevibacterium jeotgali TaxID=1262550 RepID=A0A2H1L697_9MICO|nr:hypothetical protein [Brevibacterium jeotgali]TWB98883.1 hypothetical protein FB108_2782 [Brevibacterium jeotgali]SMY12285.1 Uncharacterized conserved protein [Brevibacterium jeotgali]
MQWGWIVLVAVIALVAGIVVLLTIRYNQLSLNRSLTREARRQFDVARAARHGLIPVYVGAARRVLGEDPRIADLESAVVTAQAVRTRSDAGVAEHAMTDAVRVVAAGTWEKAATAEAAVRFADDLLVQLEAHETHIGAAVRHHNASVRAYTRRRARILSLPWHGVYAEITQIDYAPSELDEHHIEDTVSPGSENYRPGRVGEDL